MTCKTRVSTRSVLSPVSDLLGITNGSKRTNRSGVFRSAFPRTWPVACRARPHPPPLVLVDVHADVQRLGSAEQDQGRRRRRRRGELPHAQLDLQHLGVDRRAHGAPLDLHLGGMGLRLGRRELGPGLLELGRRRLHRRAPARHLLGADRPSVLHLFGKLELPLQVLQARLRHRRPAPGPRPPPAASRRGRREGGGRRARTAGRRPSPLPGGDENPRHHPVQRRAHRDVLGAGLDQAHRRDRVREVRDRGRSRRLGTLPAGLGPGDGEGRPQRRPGCR